MRRAIVLGVGALVLAGLCSTAVAAWPAAGSGDGRASSDATPTAQPAAPTTSVSGSTVTLTFAAVRTVSGLNPATSYTISRYPTAVATTPSATVSCTPATLTAPSCTDSPGAGTTTFYTYTPKWGANWNGVESSKSTGTTVAAAFSVTSVSPTARGQNSAQTTLTVNGTGFVNGSSISISGAGLTVGTTTFVSATQLTTTVSVAAGAAIGPRDVTVTKTGPTTATCTGCFTVTAAPTISSTSPSGALPHDGAVTTVTVNGTGFVSGFAATTSGPSYVVTGTTFVSSTQVTVDVKNTNTNNGTDTKNLIITNLDGGSATATGALKN
jgi:hypothetical protein